MPLFPLGTVLYPGLVLPLHIFEDRYRKLVRDLLDGPEPHQFGVIDCKGFPKGAIQIKRKIGHAARAEWS